MKATSRRGEHVQDLSVATQHGTTYDVEWVTVPDRDAATVSTRKQFTDDQITRSRKLEGMWWGDGGAYFVCSFARFTDGSAAQHDGQVWFLDPDEDTIELKLHFVYTPGDQDEDDPDGPDNITVSAYGGLIIAEDGEGKQHLIGSTEDGETFFFARNEDPGERGVHRPDVLARPQDPVRQRPGARLRVRDPRAVQEATSLSAAWKPSFSAVVGATLPATSSVRPLAAERAAET